MKVIKILILIAFFASCKNQNAEKKDPSVSEAKTDEKAVENGVELTAAQLKNAQINIGKAEKRTLKGILKVNGVVDVPPQNLVSVSVPLGGYLKKTDLLPGMPVKKGQILAIVEDAVYVQLEQDYLTADARLEYLQQELARQTELSDQKINAGKTLQQVQNEVKMQQILKKGLSEKLRLIGLNPDVLTENSLTRSVTILSPINGYVSKVNVNIGKYLAPMDVPFQLVNTDDIHANLTVFERDISKLKIGQKVKITLPNAPEKAYFAEIILIGRDLNANRAVEVHCHFVPNEPKLAPGMFLSADIETTETDALTVPSEAVVRFENKHFIFIEKSEGKYEMREVTLGVADKNFQQIGGLLITSGPLSIEGILASKIVIKGAYTLLSKMKNTAEE
jgi:membrane fusion protein, heavy metal efflux system